MPILITGVAGFIGSALAVRLLEQGMSVVGIDNISDYYDTHLKMKRLERCQRYSAFRFQKLDIVNREAMRDFFAENCFEYVIHLAAQPGVRYSVQNPDVYIDTNLVGFANLLENSQKNQIKHFVYASSSSVYGSNIKLPFSEHDPVDHPLSLYGATKRANELIAHSYAHIYHMPCTGLRFFTVYGPWCRPDMALYKFARCILEDQPIPVFNHGKMMRDFTYIDDIVEGIVRIMPVLPLATPGHAPDSATSETAPYRIYNIGNHKPIELQQYIALLEQSLGKKACLEMMPMQQGDVLNTYADVNDFEQQVGVLPHTPIEMGVSRFVEWYKAFYNLSVTA